MTSEELEARQRLIDEALEIAKAFGIPLEGTVRRRERMGMALAAVADVRQPGEWDQAVGLEDGRSVQTRQIIDWWNKNLGESISSGSYDDVRRKDLKMLVEGGLVVQSLPDSARNSPTRGYAIEPSYLSAVRLFGQAGFAEAVETLLAGKTTLAAKLAAERELSRVPIQISEGVLLSFGPGEHNALIKAVIEEFLPRFGHAAEVLYVGDAENKKLHHEEEALDALGFFNLDHGELPDVVAYSKEENWIFLVEAVHSSGPVDPLRRQGLMKLLESCSAQPIFVTAFQDRKIFRQFLADIAWETEVWIASEADHLIHFNGHRFLGPYAT